MGQEEGKMTLWFREVAESKAEGGNLQKKIPTREQKLPSLSSRHMKCCSPPWPLANFYTTREFGTITVPVFGVVRETGGGGLLKGLQWTIRSVQYVQCPVQLTVYSVLYS